MFGSVKTQNKGGNIVAKFFLPGHDFFSFKFLTNPLGTLLKKVLCLKTLEGLRDWVSKIGHSVGVFFVIYPLENPSPYTTTFQGTNGPKSVRSSGSSLSLPLHTIRRRSVVVLAACCQRANLIPRQQYKAWSVCSLSLSLSLFSFFHNLSHLKYDNNLVCDFSSDLK